MSKKIIHLLGDSLIGYGNWQQLLPDYSTISEGIPGERADELLQRLPSPPKTIEPDVFIIMTGTNNLLLYGESSFTITIKQIVTNLASSNASAKIILTSLLPFDIPGIGESVSSVNDELKIISAKTGTIYFDLFTPFAQSSENLFGFDGVHLNARGYRLWSQLLADLLPQLLHYSEG